MPDDTSKRCSKCGETKPLDAFYPNQRGRYGRHSQCKLCHAEVHQASRAMADPSIERARRRARYEKADKAAIARYVRERRKANPELAKAADARWRMSHRESIRAKRNAWGAANPDRVREQNRTYRNSNIEKERERAVRYRAAHLEEQRARAQARHAENAERYRTQNRAWRAANPDKVHENRAKHRARKLNAYVAPVSRRAIYERDGGKCGICRKHVRFKDMQIDHIVPLARGGTHEPKNVQVAHALCNQRKHATGPGQLRLLE